MTDKDTIELPEESENIKYGDIEIPDDAFDPKSAKIRISMMVPLDVQKAFKELATKRGTKYQVLMNEVLRDYIDQVQSTALIDALKAINEFSASTGATFDEVLKELKNQKDSKVSETATS